ncbi:phage protein [Gluconobacter frateurii M-2]|nr:phage protein [Gluconobacter frateurii M-2]
MIDFDKLALSPCMEAFAEPAQWQSGRLGDWNDISGIYDEAYLPVDLIGAEDGIIGSHITSAKPVLGVQQSQYAIYGCEPEQSDVIKLRGRTFRIHETQPDGRGGLLLILNDAARESDALPKYPEGFGCRSS